MKLRKCISFLLASAMMFNAMTAYAAVNAEGVCEHHPEHTAECGYSEENGVPCGNVCDIHGVNALADDGVSENVASVTKDGNTTYVASLVDAFTSAISCAEVKLLRDADVAETIVIGENYPASLDLAGHTLGGCNTVINVSAGVAFNVLDSVGGGAIAETIRATNYNAVLTMEGGYCESVVIERGQLKVTGEGVYLKELFLNNNPVQLSAGTYGYIQWEWL